MKSIIHQLKIALFMLLSFAIINLGSVYFQINTMNHDGAIVNYAGVVRGNSQRFVKLNLLQENPQAVVNHIDEVIDGLKNGNKKLNLVRVNSTEFQRSLATFEQQWSKVKQLLTQVHSAPITPNLRQTVLTESEELWILSNAAVQQAENYAINHVNQAKQLAVVLFLINLTVLAVIQNIIQKITQRLQRSVHTIASSSTEIAATVEEQERMTSQYADSMQKTHVTVDDLTSFAQESAQQANLAADEAQRVLQLSRLGDQSVAETLDNVARLEKQVQAIASEIGNLNQQTTQISGIVQVVRDLATQTNMLALNAAVEAVRAGEQGHGFAVVAKEIRHLADRSKKAANEISTIISEIQTAIHTTVTAAEGGTQDVMKTAIIAGRASESFQGVAIAIDQIASRLRQISTMANQQARAVEQVFMTLSDLSQAAQESAIGTTQTRQGTQDLNETVKILAAML